MSIDLVERLRGKPIRGDHVSKLLEVAADEIERLRAIANTTDTMTEQAIKRQNDEIERLRKHVSDALTVLNACRIAIKNRDQRPDEMKLLDAIKIVIAEIEP
jgi:DNA primase large subunit